MSHAVNADKIQLLYRHYGEEEGGRTIDLSGVRLWLSEDGTELVAVDVPDGYELWSDGAPIKRGAMNITRLSQDKYLVGAVVITRVPEGWAAIPPPAHGLGHDASRTPERPLFTLPTLDEALDMAAGAIEMFRPA